MDREEQLIGLGLYMIEHGFTTDDVDAVMNALMKQYLLATLSSLSNKSANDSKMRNG